MNKIPNRSKIMKKFLRS